MVEIEDALNIISKEAIPQHTVDMPLDKALDMVLCKETFAPMDSPSFDNSAMDGYAIGASGQEFKIKGIIQAGDTKTYEIKKGEAYRIFTGAKVPENCWSVIKQELATVENDVLYFSTPPLANKNIRRKAEQLKKGESIASIGTRLTPGLIGLLASHGFSKVYVYKRPRIKMLVTGDELKEIGEPLKDGEIYESNAITLKTAAQRYGFIIKEKTKVDDSLNATKKALKYAFETNDIVLVSGGISIGDYDFVRPAFLEIGGEELFYKINQKPGKPLFFGKYQGKYLFALPGNPASALTCLYIYCIPFFRKFTGHQKPFFPSFSCELTNDFNKSFEIPVFLKAFLEITEQGPQVTILNKQNSSMLHPFSSANAFVYLEAGKKIYQRKDDVTVKLLHAL